MRAWIALAVVGCSFPEKHHGAGASDATVVDVHEIDARAPDANPLGCAGQPFSTTAPAQITISGEAADFGTGVIANGITVNGMNEVGNNLFTQVTDAQGKFSKTLATGDSAIDGHVVTAAGTYVPSYYYPSHPFDADSDVPLQMLKPSELSLVGNPPNSALVEMIIGDCLNVGLAGCTVAINPSPSKIEYTIGGMLNMGATSTESSGAALAFGLPAGITTFNATCPGIGALRTKQVQLEVDSTFFIRLQP